MYCIKNLFLEKTIDKRLTDWYNRERNKKAELCNGSTTDSDSVCWGSNPYSAAKYRIPRKSLCFKGLRGIFIAFYFILFYNNCKFQTMKYDRIRYATGDQTGD